MARKPTFGTPDSSKAYIFPQRRRLRGALSIGGVALVLLFFGGDSLTHRKALLTAGPLSKSHAIAGSECSKCHVAWSAPPDRLCIGCHDPLPSVSRFGAIAHAERAGARSRRPEHPLRCVRCHTEHRGATASISSTRNEVCAGCHGFRSFKSGHPEFRPLREKIREPAHMKFDHQKHLEELKKENGKEPEAQCGACHKKALDSGDFETIAFDSDCARCHFDKTHNIGDTDFVSADLVATPEALLAASPAPEWVLEYQNHFVERRGRIQDTTVLHRDAWILYNVRRLAEEIQASPAAGETAAKAAPDTASEIEARRREISDIDQQIEILGGKNSPAKLKRRLSQIQAQEARLTSEIEQLDKRILEAAPRAANAPPPVTSPQLQASLKEIDAALELVASRPEPWAQAEAKRLRELRDETAAGLDKPGPGWSEYGVGQREARLIGLLDSMGTSGAPTSAVSEARQEMGSIEAPAQAPKGPALDEDQRRAALKEVDADIAVLAGSGRKWSEDEARALGTKRDRLETGKEDLSGKWNAGQIAKRKEDAASRIEELARLRAPGEAVASMKSDLEAVTSGSTSGAASLQPEREQKQRSLSSLKREEEKIQAALGSGTVDENRLAGLREKRHQVQGEIEALQQLQSQAPAKPPADPEELQKTVDKLLKPCLKCHVQSGLVLEKPAPARRLLTTSTFTHGPHLKVAKCLDCHGGIPTSKVAEDLSMAGVNKCRECHKWGGAAATCRSCHHYHPEPGKGSVANLAAAGGAENPS